MHTQNSLSQHSNQFNTCWKIYDVQGIVLFSLKKKNKSAPFMELSVLKSSANSPVYAQSQV